MTSVPRRLQRQRSRARLHRLSLIAALVVASAGITLNVPPAIFIGIAWLAGAGIAPLADIHNDGSRTGFGILAAATAVFLHDLLAWR